VARELGYTNGMQIRRDVISRRIADSSRPSRQMATHYRQRAATGASASRREMTSRRICMPLV